ncbi:MAG: flagellin [Campylobacterota bacterium]|nr:flagellin [Campylobacterota bacterium]
MDINTNYTNLPGISDVHSTSLERIATGLAINSASDDASGLQIADALGSQKTALSQSIENMSSGIVMGNIAQSGIASQKDILENIKTETLKAMSGTTSTQGKEVIADQISKYIDQYEQIANSTTYNDQTLLRANGDASDDLSIVGDETIIEMERVDTVSIADKLRTALSTFTNSRDDMSNMLNVVEEGSTQLASFASDFGSAANAMESNARNAISSEKELASSRSTILEIDYSKEISDFSKANILTQIGMIVQSQSNAVQSRTVNLLS